MFYRIWSYTTKSDILVSDHPLTMFHIVFTEPSSNFVQTDKALLRCPHLTDGQKITWQLIASVCWHGESSKTINGWADVSKANGIEYKKFMDRLKSLKRAGGLITNEDGEWELVIPTAKHEPTIQDEVEDQGKRKHTMTQKESWELVKKGWNKDKPEAWLRLDGAMNLPVMIALETHTKRLGIERPDYERFVAQLCRGAGTDAWWSRQTMKASSVFGFSKVSDKKFENVEKLYKLGASVESKIDYNCDADILARYHEKGHDQLVKVIRLEAVDRLSAQEHLFGIPEDEYDATAAYVYFTENSERPVYWSFENRNSTRYLFS